MLRPDHLLRRLLPRRFSLIQKLTILTGTVVVLFMTLFAWVNINNLQKLLVNNTIRDLDNLASTIIRMTRHQMLVDNRTIVYQMINEVANRPGVERIRMINRDGVIVHSTATDEIGQLLDQKAARCSLCHKPGQTLTRPPLLERSRFFTLPDGKQVMGLAKAVQNEQSCSTAACHAHAGSTRVLGVVDIIVSLDVLKADLASYRNRIILLTVLLIILLGASLTFFTLHLVNRPVNELLRHTARLAQGQLDCEMTPTSNDELGELMRAFQLMTSNLRQARNDLEEWGRTLEEKVRDRSDQLQRMQMQLVHTEKLASLGELVAGIAHEINNPLSGILIFSSLAAKDKRLDPALQGDLETISSEAQRCAGIVKGLLEFARDYQPKMTVCEINQVVLDSLRLVECQSVFQNVAILRQLDNDLPQIMADQNQLKQVFINIFINAGQAMQDLKRGELKIITTRAVEPEGGVMVRISDSGCGVPEEQLGKLFDPFFTTKGTGGTGLGLSVSYGIIQAHGGTITAESVIGVGTTFRISLPACTGEKNSE
ncbi:integral membrane sensor signal transduction histidine kinase [Trichlorobacter lovleyi SZ]|uniref:histidine kinase n=1 Tax=Trichlorobacter lovleyi (strain ATCC BAA-1151 / DSM 17278 / SZ) TaxID=398767 RepID=B3EAH3_TRIL1|nr:integral membrane sensor signal transduction histidine kinase [Trichlorobacter lovleyi SZ]